ncbi:MAG: thioredoxin domain-containing protein [Gammaproteobacteria bacterium]
MKHRLPVLTVLLFSFGLLLPAGPQAAGDMDSLRSDIEELKKGQAEIRKQLGDLIKLVTPKKREVVSDINVLLNVENYPAKGSAEAPLTLVEFTDYQCPFCSRHVNSVLPQLIKDYVDSGKVHYVLVDFPLPFHKEAKNAAIAAHCAGEQGKYWEMHNALFANQKALGKDKLPEYAGTLALDMGMFDECMGSGRHASMVDDGLKAGGQATVKGTPSFVIGVSQADGTTVKGSKLIRGAVGYAVFQKTLNDMLNKDKQPAPQAEQKKVP